MKWLLTPCIAVLTLHAVAGAAPPSDAETVQLERRYLECNRLASTQLLPSGTAAACSVIAQRLLAQRFGGDFERLLKWSVTAREAGDDSGAAFDAAQAHYEAGRFAEAYEAFGRLADCGHREAARIALQMHKLGSRLYGVDFATRPPQLLRWQAALSAGAHDGSGGCSAA
jgi:hypothetical protein